MGFNIFNDPDVTAALGLTPGADVLYKFGTRAGIAATEWKDIWSGTSDVYGGFLEFGVTTQLDLVSDNVNDTLLGTGCRKVRIIGLDVNYRIQSIVYDMTGLTVFTTPELWTRVWRMRCVDSQDRRLPNLGTILATSQTAGAPVMGCIPAPVATNEVVGGTLTTNFTMPADTVGIAVVSSVGMSNDKVGNVRIIASQISETGSTPFAAQIDVPVNGGPSPLPLIFTIPPLCDIIAQAKTETGMSTAFLAYKVYVVAESSVGSTAANRGALLQADRGLQLS